MGHWVLLGLTEVSAGGPLNSRWWGWWPVSPALSAAPAFATAATVARVLVTQPGVYYRVWDGALGATGAYTEVSAGGPLENQWWGWRPVSPALSAAPAFAAAATVVRMLVARPGVYYHDWDGALGASGAYIEVSAGGAAGR